MEMVSPVRDDSESSTCEFFQPIKPIVAPEELALTDEGGSTKSPPFLRFFCIAVDHILLNHIQY